MPTTDTPRAIEAKAALARLVRHTLEVMCFADAELLPAAVAPANAVTACVSFSGSRLGYLQLETEQEAAITLTAACLGLDRSDADLGKHVDGTLEELASVVCGRVMTSLDPTARFEMRPAPALDKANEGIQQTFRLDFGILRAILQLC